jgi:hypothetical protein
MVSPILAVDRDHIMFNMSITSAMMQQTSVEVWERSLLWKVDNEQVSYGVRKPVAHYDVTGSEECTLATTISFVSGL